MSRFGATSARIPARYSPELGRICACPVLITPLEGIQPRVQSRNRIVSHEGRRHELFSVSFSFQSLSYIPLNRTDAYADVIDSIQRENGIQTYKDRLFISDLKSVVTCIEALHQAEFASLITLLHNEIRAENEPVRANDADVRVLLSVNHQISCCCCCCFPDKEPFIASTGRHSCFQFVSNRCGTMQ